MKVVKIDLKNIEQNENSRVIYKAAEVAELMHSMKQDGLLQPVGVAKTKNGKYEAVFGNRRIMAARKLGWADIDATILDLESANDRDITNLIENMKRQNTTVAEDGRIFQALLNRKLTTKEIAARLGVSETRIELGLEVFNDVPKEFQAKIVNRTGGHKPKHMISATSAHMILNIRKTYGLNRKQTRALMNYAAIDGSSTQHMSHIAPLLKDGFTVADAIKAVDKMARISLFVFIDENKIKKLEEKHKTSISQLLWQQLEKNEELGVRRVPSNAYRGRVSSHSIQRTLAGS